jgi:hypothetical protein
VVRGWEPAHGQEIFEEGSQRHKGKVGKEGRAQIERERSIRLGLGEASTTEAQEIGSWDMSDPRRERDKTSDVEKKQEQDGQKDRGRTRDGNVQDVTDWNRPPRPSRDEQEG